MVLISWQVGFVTCCFKFYVSITSFYFQKALEIFYSQYCVSRNYNIFVPCPCYFCSMTLLFLFHVLVIFVPCPFHVPCPCYFCSMTLLFLFHVLSMFHVLVIFVPCPCYFCSMTLLFLFHVLVIFGPCPFHVPCPCYFCSMSLLPLGEWCLTFESILVFLYLQDEVGRKHHLGSFYFCFFLDILFIYVRWFFLTC